jgi:hypothetical protein
MLGAYLSKHQSVTQSPLSWFSYYILSMCHLFKYIYIGTRGLLRHYAASRKVAGSIPNNVTEFFFNLPNPSSRTVTLG